MRNKSESGIKRFLDESGSESRFDCSWIYCLPGEHVLREQVFAIWDAP